MMELGQRAEALAKELIAPMLAGGEAALQRPFGKLALEVGADRNVVDNELRTLIDNARLREARRIVAVDVLPPLSPVEWALAATLNDLLQTTNHELSSFVTRSRHVELLEVTGEVVRQLPPCSNVEELVCRYATFTRALALSRTDTNVSWWTGSQAFRGQPPHARLLAWPGLRNVQVHRQQVELVDMAEGVPLPDGGFETLVNAWLQQSPLSDIALAARSTPTFQWTPHSLSAISSVAGCNLALRAITVRGQLEAATAALARANQNLSAELRQWPDYFVQQLHGAAHHWAAE